ncbi:prepilin peptidase, partial [Cribrihabitans sp. XS_ASV171]
MNMLDASHHLMSVWFIAGLLCAALNDAWRMRIPNGLVLGLLAGYAVAIALWQPPLAKIAVNAAAAAAAIFAGGMILFARDWIGGGDVKLLAVAGLWVGAAATPALLLLTAMAGGVVTVALIA